MRGFIDKLKKIPVLGYLLRWLIALVKLPKRFDEVVQIQTAMKDEYKRWSEDKKNEIKELQQWNSERMDEIRELQQWNSDRMDEIRELQQWNSDRMDEISKLRVLDIPADYIEQINYRCSSTPCLWGEKERLHISDKAAVFTCMFNTNSGEITIGDYTFAGSGVSILAGSHDMHLKGKERREQELKDGCDIVIGNGVWLASNCTILGPCEIGDDAVIAAGAVVVPNTKVPPGAVYGGTPAKFIKNSED